MLRRQLSWLQTRGLVEVVVAGFELVLVAGTGVMLVDVDLVDELVNVDEKEELVVDDLLEKMGFEDEDEDSTVSDEEEELAVYDLLVELIVDKGDVGLKDDDEDKELTVDDLLKGLVIGVLEDIKDEDIALVREAEPGTTNVCPMSRRSQLTPGLRASRISKVVFIFAAIPYP